MVIDVRRDHSLRIPRPDLSVKLGTPNACTNCHKDKSAQWALVAANEWWPGQLAKGFQHFAETLHAGSIGAPGAEQSLAELVTDRDQPAIARATALSMLAAYDPPSADATVRAGVADDSALVRRAAVRALSNSDPRTSVVTLAPLLHDPVRAVRLEAAEVVAGTPPDAVSSGVGLELNNSFDEYIASQELNADRPEAHLNLGLLYAKEHELAKAETELKIALSLDPAFAPAAVNLADLYRGQNRDKEGEQILRDAMSRSPDDASLQHALGLLMVREKRSAQALALLAAAARIDPNNARYAYVYAIALKDAGQANAAIETLTRSVDAHPYDRDSLAALVTFLEQAGDPAKALVYARRLGDLEPASPEVHRMLIELNERQRG
jgi:tetratricopeptide (TPR) repeat protein